MKTLYIDCGMGAAGDMITAALFELLPGKEQEDLLAGLQNMGLEGVKVLKTRVSKCGISGTHMRVFVDGVEEQSEDVHETDHHHDHGQHSHHGHEHDSGHHAHEHEHDHDGGGAHHGHHTHSHMHMTDIEAMVEALVLPEKVKKDVLSVYRIIAEAESCAHGTEVSEVHFHEVGMKDAIMDVAAVCLLMDHISPDRVVASPVHVGSGQVRCAHGIMPVPAPATAYILRGIPFYSTDLKGELCTPTGAALLKYFADEFGPMPAMTVREIGYGMGSKDFPRANCLRMMLGESYGALPQEGGRDKVTGLSCNVDDMTGEEIGFAMERLYEAGAKEVYTVPIGMKKNRPGIMLSVLCRPEDKDTVVRVMFRHTTTIGIRETEFDRYILDRSGEEKETCYGTLHIKRSEGYGVSRRKYEYEELAEKARKNGVSIRDILEKTDK
ncbi:MAG: nickel pincer cofactor biosynthesis protein LarC [Lachnospiraceae bacterium]|nr:nickel pincer cofactor biosynthesis protein LarC [Lachnospiraceae bacterium]